MSKLALLWFYNEHTEERIGRDIESPFIPRIGELVGLEGQTWLVRNIDYLWPQPGSRSYVEGDRRPIVRLFVSEDEGPFSADYLTEEET